MTSIITTTTEMATGGDSIFLSSAAKVADDRMDSKRALGPADGLKSDRRVDEVDELRAGVVVGPTSS